MSTRHSVFAAALEAIGKSGLGSLLAPLTRGLGVILTLHRVRASSGRGFSPNGILEVTPEFLDVALACLKSLGYELVTLTEAVARLRTGRGRTPFAALTFDDGYRDNLSEALPVLERHGAPMTLFVTPGFAERSARLWWLELEEALRRLDHVRIERDDLRFAALARNDGEKARAFEALYWRLREMPEDRRLDVVATLSGEARIDAYALVDRLCLDWDGVSQMARHPLVSIGAHTLAHPILAKCDEAGMRQEIAGSREAIRRRLGAMPAYLSYPFGDRQAAGLREFEAAAELGFAGAVTTRPGVLFSAHARHLHALPRISMNGLFQEARLFETLVSGVPTLIWNRGRRCDAA
ncbi:MAG: polysaccharide deacetylase family protein [Hyphomicrobiales bacterium]|nr:polysaccharide deacetylase family protein [Hyphomicrobiales bacterium]